MPTSERKPRFSCPPQAVQEHELPFRGALGRLEQAVLKDAHQFVDDGDPDGACGAANAVLQHSPDDLVSRFKVIVDAASLHLGRRPAEIAGNEDVREFYLELSDAGERKSFGDVKHYRCRKRWLG